MHGFLVSFTVCLRLCSVCAISGEATPRSPVCQSGIMHLVCVTSAHPFVMVRHPRTQHCRRTPHACGVTKPHGSSFRGVHAIPRLRIYQGLITPQASSAVWHGFERQKEWRCRSIHVCGLVSSVCGAINSSYYWFSNKLANYNIHYR